MASTAAADEPESHSMHVDDADAENSADNANSASATAAAAADKSALEDNIERKGKNAYYFAHAHKATGPKWDGKIEPKLLGKKSRETSAASATSSSSGGAQPPQPGSQPSFRSDSNITSYAFLDEEAAVKIYVDVPGAAERYPDEGDVRLDHTSDSFELTLWDKSGGDGGAEGGGDGDDGGDGNPSSTSSGSGGGRVCERRLAFNSLYGPIEGASFRKKKDRIVVTLVKSEIKEWPCIGRK